MFQAPDEMEEFIHKSEDTPFTEAKVEAELERLREPDLPGHRPAYLFDWAGKLIDLAVSGC